MTDESSCYRTRSAQLLGQQGARFCPVSERPPCLQVTTRNQISTPTTAYRVRQQIRNVNAERSFLMQGT